MGGNDEPYGLNSDHPKSVMFRSGAFIREVVECKNQQNGSNNEESEKSIQQCESTMKNQQKR